MNTYKMMYVLELRTVYALTRGLFWSLFRELHSNEANKYQNNTRVIIIILKFLIRHNEALNDDKTLGLHSADDVTIDCQWRRNGQTIVARSRE